MNNLKNSFYITTPIYYINADPHIGHSYTTIAADVLARYHRLLGRKVFFLTGTDEHGQKIEEAAKANGKSPKDFADEIVEKYKKLWLELDISYDKFIRTTDEKHKKTVQKIIEILFEKGDIYKGKYEGLYCIPCETYFLETELLDRNQKICPDCGRELSIVSEDSYFFKLSKYQDVLLKYFDEHKDFLAPHFRAKEMINIIKSGLKDLSITRNSVSWGIKNPLDEKETIYVWFDALVNYISAIDFLDFVEDKKNIFIEIWPADIHLVGKEIYKFHTLIWPAILFGLGIDLPKKVFGHGWWTFEGEKMSKSKGNAIDPYKIINIFGKDVLRYFLLREVPFGVDGDFSMASLIDKYNGELANEIGNLFSRTLNMIEKYCNKIVPDITLENNILFEKANEVIKEYSYSMEQIDIMKALIKTLELVKMSNKYIEDEAPWKLVKVESIENKLKLEKVLFNCLATMRVIAILLNPFMPTSTEKMLKQLGISELNFNENLVRWEDMPKNYRIGEIDIIFPRYENI
jgi:methionyl-tRNA synthetase